VSAKPELLYLSHRLPIPPHNGAAIRTFNVIRVLSETYKITALCFDRTDAILARLNLEERIDGLRPYADVQVFPILQQQSRGRLILDHARSVLTNEAYTVFAYDSPAFTAAVKRALAEHTFALVHVDSLDLARYLPLFDGLPVACTHHNVESQLLRRRALTEPPFRRAYLNFQAAKLERLERRWLPRVSVNVAVSDDDAQTFRKLVPGVRVEIAPNGVDIDYFKPTDERNQAGTVFVGGTNWFPNRDGLEWFHRDILPELRALGEDGPVTWVGRCTEADKQRFGGPDGVIFTDYVPDVRPFLHQASCFIAPLRVGGGTRLKILDAWACGSAVVSTSRGSEGLETVDGTNILIADEPRPFALAIQRVIKDAALRASLGRAGRETVVRRYSWTSIGRDLSAVYAEIQTSPGAKQPRVPRSA
jgi:glycosyltransferase involved in cell wall biosynthesis